MSVKPGQTHGDPIIAERVADGDWSTPHTGVNGLSRRPAMTRASSGRVQARLPTVLPREASHPDNQ